MLVTVHEEVGATSVVALSLCRHKTAQNTHCPCIRICPMIQTHMLHLQLWLETTRASCSLQCWADEVLPQQQKWVESRNLYAVELYMVTKQLAACSSFFPRGIQSKIQLDKADCRSSTSRVRLGFSEPFPCLSGCTVSSKLDINRLKPR